MLGTAMQACRAEVSSGIYVDCEEKIKAKGPEQSCSSDGMQFPYQKQAFLPLEEERSTASKGLSRTGLEGTGACKVRE